MGGGEEKEKKDYSSSKHRIWLLTAPNKEYFFTSYIYMYIYLLIQDRIKWVHEVY